jgi:hypothetical protein
MVRVSQWLMNLVKMRHGRSSNWLCSWKRHSVLKSESKHDAEQMCATLYSNSTLQLARLSFNEATTFHPRSDLGDACRVGV